jgi:hypothetical protein
MTKRARISIGGLGLGGELRMTPVPAPAPMADPALAPVDPLFLIAEEVDLAPLLEEFGREEPVLEPDGTAPRGVTVPPALVVFGAPEPLDDFWLGRWLTAPIARIAPAWAVPALAPEPAAAPALGPILELPLPDMPDCTACALRCTADAGFEDAAVGFEPEARIEDGYLFGG